MSATVLAATLCGGCIGTVFEDVRIVETDAPCPAFYMLDLPSDAVVVDVERAPYPGYAVCWYAFANDCAGEQHEALIASSLHPGRSSPVYGQGELDDPKGLTAVYACDGATLVGGWPFEADEPCPSTSPGGSGAHPLIATDAVPERVTCTYSYTSESSEWF